MQEVITLFCSVCKRRNYTGSRNTRKKKDKVELRKYCRWCNKHTIHRETK